MDTRRKELVDSVKLSLEKVVDEGWLGPDAMLISRSWLTKWKIKQCRLSHLSESVSPTGSITCRHGHLLPEVSGIGRCVTQTQCMLLAAEALF